MELPTPSHSTSLNRQNNQLPTLAGPCVHHNVHHCEYCQNTIGPGEVFPCIIRGLLFETFPDSKSQFKATNKSGGSSPISIIKIPFTSRRHIIPTVTKHDSNSVLPSLNMFCNVKGNRKASFIISRKSRFKDMVGNFFHRLYKVLSNLRLRYSG